MSSLVIRTRTMDRLTDRLHAAGAWLLPAAMLAAAVPGAASAADPSPIQDNSFLIEEAYNQEPGVIQHISNFNRSSGGAWYYAFTEEWPVRGQTHQASVTFQFQRLDTSAQGVGDMALNYRWQALGSGETPVALAPRVTLLLPTGDAARGLGAGGTGVQVNLPLSVVLSEQFVTHANLGGTYVPSARAQDGGSALLGSFNIGQSLVWLAHHNFNFLVEALYTSQWLGAQRTDSIIVNPGVRAAIDLPGGLQVVPGVSVPVTLGAGQPSTGLFFYLSFEHPFRLAGPQAERT
jgi:hypothetical protein